VLGYLAAGLVIGPFGMSAIADPKEAEGLAEFGVIFLLFAIGLDLPLERLRAMRRYIFGLGALQVVVTGSAFTVIGVALGLRPETAAVVGGTLALSSTATVLQLLVERGEAAARFVPHLGFRPLVPGFGSGAAAGADSPPRRRWHH
jgi:CPA2 family monovalent cation:H+ antiporter-2